MAIVRLAILSVAVFVAGDAAAQSVSPPNGQSRSGQISMASAARAATADALASASVDAGLSESLKRIVQRWAFAPLTAPWTPSAAAALSLSLGAAQTTTTNKLLKFTNEVGSTGEAAISESEGVVSIPGYLRVGNAPATAQTLQVKSSVSRTPIAWQGSEASAATGYLYSDTSNTGLTSTPGSFDGTTAAVLVSTAGTATLYTGGATRLHVTPTGNIGIGTTAPLQALHVSGSALVTGDAFVNGNNEVTGITTTGTLRVGGPGGLAVARDGTYVVVNGNLRATGTLEAKYQDVAEWVDAVEPLPAATVVAAHPTLSNHVQRSTRAYDTTVLGVVSEQPGLLLGESGGGKVAVAQSGRVKVRVDARFGAIAPGELLVASPIPGVAMRSKPMRSGLHRPGTIIGKALEAWQAGQGDILVLLTLQ
jgi:hypothetical protein